MLELTTDLAVRAGPADLFALLADPVRVAPCLPGLEVDDSGALSRPLAAGDEFAGCIRLRVGSMGQECHGTARVLELDPSAGLTVLGARGEDTRGFSSVDATVMLTVEAGPDDGSVLRIEVVLDLGGSVAQLGPGAVRRVVEHLLEGFAANLRSALDGGVPAATTPAAPRRTRAGAARAPRPRAGAGTAIAPAAVTAALAFACGALVGRGTRLRRS